MPDTLIDGNFSGPVEVGEVRLEYPFRKNGDRTTAFFEQDYWQRLETYVPVELGAPHPTLRDFYLIKESKPVQMIANAVRFTRTYSRIPTTQTVYSTVSFNKPSLVGVATVANANNVTGSGTYTSIGSFYPYISYCWDFTNNRVFGPLTVTTSATSGSDTNLTWTGHGITTQRFVVNVSGTYYIFNSGQYSVTDANTLKLLGFTFGTAATSAFKYLRDYTPGIDRVSCKSVSTFYLPGVTAGITTGADISIPNPLLNDAAFLAAVVANTSGWLNYDSDSLTQWMESPIYELLCTQLNMADL